MKKSVCLLGAALLSVAQLAAQDNPAIISWLINTTGETGRHYVSGNSTPITDTAKVNVQKVQYSDNNAYINCSGIPSYIIGPYLDGNPALATNNDWLFQVPLNPEKNEGTLTSTPMGVIGVFINGVPMYDYKDGVSYDSGSQSDEQMGGEGVWNRNAILAENDGFDCAKGHPSPIFNGPPGPGGTLEGGSYHHHQNPTAFNLDLVEISDICDLYLADGLYTISDSEHSPLIGYAFDGYPVYGAYAYSNPDQLGGELARMETSYQLRDITSRTTYADGSTVTTGPDVSDDYPLGWYREDYEFVENSGDLDQHNGRFCKTPEYPDGTYAYFATVDENWNSTFPYLIGLEYYGIVEEDNFSGMGGNNVSIDEEVTEYDSDLTIIEEGVSKDISIFPNPGSEFLALQVKGLLNHVLDIKMYDLKGQLVRETKIQPGSTIWHIDTRTLYSGEYVIHINNGTSTQVEKVLIFRE